MDTTQLLLTIVLSLSTILLVIIGLQLVFILRELRKVLKNINQVIDEFGSLGSGLQGGLSEITGFLNGFKTIIKVIDIALPKKHEKTK
ncbi:MAG: hypothetical protein HYW86_01305 [Candidatus Roizmanbacteria bacterium]|nr:MAG: hypothetical protein HYW86_01305 [Candidatus Roizmanbacteria bacterium]